MAITWDPVERWLRNKKKETQRHYKFHFNEFLKKSEKKFGFASGTGFLEWAQAQSQGVAVQESIEGYTDNLTESVKGQATSAIRTFLTRNGYRDLPTLGVPAYRGEYIRGYTREEIILLLSYLDDPIQKLYVLFEKDDGFRAGTNISLKWHHLKQDYDAGLRFIHPYLETEYYQGRKSAGLSFIGPDSLSVLKPLIKQGEVVINPKICDPRKPDKCECETVFPFSYKTIYEILRRAKKKAGLPESIQPTHGLRKFFENALDKCEPSLDLDKKRQLEGHSLGVRRNYTDQVESLRPLYEKAYEHLSLSEEAVADRKMKSLMDEIRELRAENQNMKDMEARLEILEAQLVGRRVIVRGS
jgi:hypothetical protein